MAENRTPQQRVEAQAVGERVESEVKRQFEFLAQHFLNVLGDFRDSSRGAQEDIAERMNVGVSTVSRWFSGTNPSLDSLLRLCAARGEDLSTFVAKALHHGNSRAHAMAILKSIGADEGALRSMDESEALDRDVKRWVYESLKNDASIRALSKDKPSHKLHSR